MRHPPCGRRASTRKPPPVLAAGAQRAAVEADAARASPLASSVRGVLRLGRRGPPAAGRGRRSEIDHRGRASLRRPRGRSRAPPGARGRRRGPCRRQRDPLALHLELAPAGPRPRALDQALGRASVGCGASARPSSSRRSTPSSRRISASASRPVSSIGRSAWPALGGVARGERPRHRLGLHDHRADAVGHQRLELRRDPRALVLDRALGRAASRSASRRAALAQLAPGVAPGCASSAGEQRRGEQGPVQSTSSGSSAMGSGHAHAPTSTSSTPAPRSAALGVAAEGVEQVEEGQERAWSCCR